MKLFSRYKSEEAVETLLLAIKSVSADSTLEGEDRKACLETLHKMRKAFKKRKQFIIV